jgi:thermostable 8-oxoguanine DNA glycosylase
MVFEDDDPRVARRRLLGLGCGLGVKQASLFVRNVRRSANLAVLDVHSLAFMRMVGLATALEVPTGPAAYERLEDRFVLYASGLGVAVRHLDRAVWIVMRAARAERI